MRSRNLASIVLLGGAFLTACADSTTAPQNEAPDVNAAVRGGEKLSRVVIRVPSSQPSSTSIRLNVGQSVQLSSMLYYSRGGSLSGTPYVQWGKQDGCTAMVTNTRSSRGKINGVKAGTVRIIAEFAGKADTVNVTVRGSGNADPSCERRRAESNKNDASNGTPAKSYRVRAGERLSKVVLFKPRGDVRVGRSMTLVAELWYNRGGRLLGNRYLGFTSLDTRVATVARGGKVTPRSAGTARMAVRLGQFADTVEFKVVR